MAPSTSAWKTLTQIPVTHPFKFGVAISTIKTSFSDLLVQTAVENKSRDEIDWKRNFAFATFGCFYLGGVQYFIYVPVFGRMFPHAATFAGKQLKDKLKDARGIKALFSQVFIDQCIHHPLLYFPVFYGIKELATNSESPDLGAAMRLYKQNMKEDLLALWKVWVPATLVNFAFMPMWARIPTVAATSLLWSCILSSMRGGDTLHSDDLVGGAVRGASFTLMKEGLNELFSSSVDLDPNLAHICISAQGPDKIGWVALVAGAVSQGGGNITHSKMLRFGHDFTILMHVAVPPNKLMPLISSLKKDKELKPLNIQTSSLRRRNTALSQKPRFGLSIHCVGQDRPGMLAAIAEKVSQSQLSVENITTELRANQHGKRDFVINCDCTAIHETTTEELEELCKDFLTLKEELKLDVLDIRALLN